MPIASCPATEYHWEKLDSLFFTPLSWTLNLPFPRLDSLRLWTPLSVSDTSVTFMVLPYMCSRCVPDSLVVTGPELAPALQTPLPRAEQRERSPLSPSANAPSHAPKALLALVTRAQWWLTSACHQAPVSCSTGSANKAFCVLWDQKRWHSNDNRFFRKCILTNKEPLSPLQFDGYQSREL